MKNGEDKHEGESQKDGEDGGTINGSNDNHEGDGKDGKTGGNGDKLVSGDGCKQYNQPKDSEDHLSKKDTYNENVSFGNSGLYISRKGVGSATNSIQHSNADNELDSMPSEKTTDKDDDASLATLKTSNKKRRVGQNNHRMKLRLRVKINKIHTTEDRSDDDDFVPSESDASSGNKEGDDGDHSGGESDGKDSDGKENDGSTQVKKPKRKWKTQYYIPGKKNRREYPIYESMKGDVSKWHAYLDEKEDDKFKKMQDEKFALTNLRGKKNQVSFLKFIRKNDGNHLWIGKSAGDDDKEYLLDYAGMVEPNFSAQFLKECREKTKQGFLAIPVGEPKK